jgi:hypothetical protein
MSADPTAMDLPVLRLELADPVPSEVPVGTTILLQAKVFGASRDLRGGRVEVAAGQEIIATAQLTVFQDDFNETSPFAVRAPDRVETLNWDVRFPRQEINGVAYGQSVLPISLQTKPHRTSLAVWAVPSPVRMAERFTITVGAKSSGGCTLCGAKIRIRDGAGTAVGEGILGDAPWPGTDALYWTEVTLPGPSVEGQQCWNVSFAVTDLELPHLGSAAEFSFTAVRPPEHRVAVTIIDSDTIAPVEETQIAIGPYRAATDKTGMAHIEVPAGMYDLAVWKSGFEAASRTIEIATDISVQFELTRLPNELTAWD